MELNSFKEAGFDPKSWINKNFALRGNQSNQAFVHNAVSRLQLYMKQLNVSIADSNSQLASTVPTILKDTGVLHNHCHLLQQRLQGLEKHVKDVETETGQSIMCLQRIDDLKNKLENASKTLREADRWDVLARAVEDIIEAGVPDKAEKLVELAEQVQAMSDGMDTLNACQDCENKKLQLETLYNRLEASITMPFLNALTAMDSELTKTYVSLFSGMRRSLSACRCWRRSAATQLAQRWHRTPDHSVRLLTEMLAHDAEQQMLWLTTVLRSEAPLTELLRLQTDLLLSLAPTPTEIVRSELSVCETPEESITLLMDLRRDLDEFAVTVKSIIEAHNINSINTEDLSPQVMREFGRALYTPLRDSLPHYTEALSLVFLKYLNESTLNQEDLLEHSRAIYNVVEKTESRLCTAYNRGLEIAGPAVHPFYAPAVENFISGLLNLISSQTRTIESKFLTAVSAGEVTGVLSETFPSALMLESAADSLLQVLATRQLELEKDNGVEAPHPLQDLSAFLLDGETKNIVKSPPASIEGLRRARDTLKGLSRSILRNPIDVQLDKIPQLSVWYNNDALSTDLPDFALSPQEYITEIGQYLMTLPQHLEMHVSDKQAPWQFLTELCTHTCEVYAEKILNVRNMDALGTKRCLTDIVYLSSVVDDLGSSITPALRSLEKSLRAATPGDRE